MHISLFASLIIYGVYLFVMIIITAIVSSKAKTPTRIVSDFFKYVYKGRKRVPLLREHMPFFFGLQLLYIVFLPYVALYIYLPITIAVFYLYALGRDRLKKHRHNGIAIGYEYPHPRFINAYKTNAQNASIPIRNISTVGSKGVYDLQIKSEPSPHVMVIGESGSGKTNLVQTFLTRCYLKFAIPFLIIDWSGSYRGTELNVNSWKVPRNLRINPFTLRGMSIERRSGVASELLQFSLNLTDLQASKVRETLSAMYVNNRAPTVQELHDRLTAMIRAERYKETKLQLVYIASKLRQSFDIFGTEPSEFWNNYDKTCNLIDLQGLTDTEKKMVTYTIVQRITEQFKEQGALKLYIALDDAYQALLNYYDKETNITKIVREGRKYGFGLLISTQMLKDLPQAIVANTPVKFVFSYHEPFEISRVHGMLDLSDLEKDILYKLPRGHCLLYDQNAMHSGRGSIAYVEIDQIKGNEARKLKESIKPITQIEIAKSAKLEMLKGGAFESKTSVQDMLKDLEIPSVSIYRYLIAIDRAGSQTGAVRMLKAKGWITSTSTLYGGAGQPSLYHRVNDSGYMEASKLSKKAERLVEPYRMIQIQGVNQGSEEHAALMRNLIKSIQDRGNFAFVPRREAFDVGEMVPMKGRKGLWDYGRIKAYEVQTNAVRSEIDRCMERQKQLGTELVFVTNSTRTKKEIERYTGMQYKVVKMKPYPDIVTQSKLVK